MSRPSPSRHQTPVGALLLALLLCPRCGDEPSPSDGSSADWEIHRLDRGIADGTVHQDASTPVAPYTFVAFGDTQPPTNSCLIPGFPAMRALPGVIVDLAPSFVIHVGDLVDRASEAGAYDTFKSCYGELLLAHPVFPTMGNHDEDWGLGILSYKTYLEEQLLLRNPQVVGSDYAQRFSVIYNDDPTPYSTDMTQPSHTDVLPSGFTHKTFYTFRYGNSAFLSFEQGVPSWTNTPKTWVEKHLRELRADPSIKHLFVFMHYPLYISTASERDPHNGLAVVRQHYEPLFQEHDVTAVFSGHAHVYYHSYVPDDGSATRQDPSPSVYPHDGQGIHYLITGGGSWSTPLGPEREEKSYHYLQARAVGNHLIQVQVDGQRLTMNVIGVEGDESGHTTTLWDSFTIE